MPQLTFEIFSEKGQNYFPPYKLSIFYKARLIENRQFVRGKIVLALFRKCDEEYGAFYF